MIKIWRDPISAMLHIKIEIPEAFSATHYFAMAEFGKIFLDMHRPFSDRLEAVAQFVRRTQEKA